MTDFCCRKFKLSASPDLAGLYGSICAAVPSCYVCGQGFSNDCLRFSLENGARAELRFQEESCEIWLPDCPPEQTQAVSAVYGPLFEELVIRLGSERKEASYG